MAAFTSTQLATEINTTRPSVYAAAKAAGDDTGIAALVNGAGVGGVTVWKPRVSAADILGSLVASEVTAWRAPMWRPAADLPKWSCGSSSRRTARPTKMRPAPRRPSSCPSGSRTPS
jgi:hypothetical protein